MEGPVLQKEKTITFSNKMFKPQSWWYPQWEFTLYGEKASWLSASQADATKLADPGKPYW